MENKKIRPEITDTDAKIAEYDEDLPWFPNMVVCSTNDH